MDKNEVKLSGIIVGEPKFSHMIGGKAVYKAIMQSVRTSGHCDYIPLNINIDLMRKVEVIEGGSYVVGGKFVSFNKNGRLLLSVQVEEINHYVLQGVDLNTMYFTGHICNNVIVRKTPLGKDVADLFVAINGEKRASYIPCIAWYKNCEIVKDMKVGTRVECVGRLQSREYNKTLPDGTIEKRTAYEVSVYYIKEID